MVDRGNCTFSTKAQNVQNAGGEIAMIVNNNPNDDLSRIFMRDDGLHQKVIIPTIMISYEDGKTIKRFWEENKNTNLVNEITLSVKFEIQKTKDGKEDIDLYFTSVEVQMYEFLRKFRDYYKELGKPLLPYYKSYT